MRLIAWLGANPEVLAVILTAIGGILLKVIERILSRNNVKVDAAKDHRDEIKELRDCLDHEEKQNLYWRNRFYEEQEDNAMLRMQMIQNNLIPATKRVEPPGSDVL